jgi:hypothetical protein
MNAVCSVICSVILAISPTTLPVCGNVFKIVCLFVCKVRGRFLRNTETPERNAGTQSCFARRLPLCHSASFPADDHGQDTELISMHVVQALIGNSFCDFYCMRTRHSLLSLHTDYAR